LQSETVYFNLSVDNNIKDKGAVTVAYC